MRPMPSLSLLSLLSLLSVALALATGCPQPPPQLTPDAGEVGECIVDLDFDTATALVYPPEGGALGDEVEGTLCPQNDTDLYKVTVQNAGDVILVHLRMDEALSDLEPIYQIIKDDGTLDGAPTPFSGSDQDKTQGEPVDFTSAHRISEPGTYYVVVRPRESFQLDNVNPYFLSVQIVPDPDPNEENNTRETATPMQPSMNAAIATAGDEDWYIAPVTAVGQIVDVIIEARADSGVEPVATFFFRDDANATESVLQQVALAADPADPTKLTAQIRQKASAGAGRSFLLQIKDGGADGDQDSQIDAVLGLYTLTTQVINDPDPNEGDGGNDEYDQATAVSDGQTVNGAIASLADDDTYQVSPSGASQNSPQVLVVTISFDELTSTNPQVRIVTPDPERGTPPPCNAACENCLPGNQCGETMMQRFITGSGFKVAFPVRNTRPIMVVVSDAGANDFQPTGGYTINFDLAADPDPGEQGDDFLIPNLEEAEFDNRENLADQYNGSRPRNAAAGFPAMCATAGAQAGCIDQATATNPVGGDFSPDVADCSDADAAARTVTLTGRLSYLGDRDYFVIPDVPARGYWTVDTTYSTSASSPIELALFMHADSFFGLVGSTVEAQEQGGCQTSIDCAPPARCVDGRCWSESDSNGAIASRGFGPASGDCVIEDVTDGRPLVIEVVDNGINDFDLNMTYTLQVRIACDCPAVCDNGQDFCQNG